MPSTSNGSSSRSGEPPQPTHAPDVLAITGASAVTRPPGDRVQVGFAVVVQAHVDGQTVRDDDEVVAVRGHVGRQQINSSGRVRPYPCRSHRALRAAVLREAAGIRCLDGTDRSEAGVGDRRATPSSRRSARAAWGPCTARSTAAATPSRSSCCTRTSATDAATRDRLRREVHALQKLRHPGVAAVLDAEADSTEAFLVTELVAGDNLEEHVRERGTLDAEELLDLAEGLRDALVAVHGAGVVHRDLKPSNVHRHRRRPGAHRLRHRAGRRRLPADRRPAWSSAPPGTWRPSCSTATSPTPRPTSGAGRRSSCSPPPAGHRSAPARWRPCSRAPAPATWTSTALGPLTATALRGALAPDAGRPHRPGRRRRGADAGRRGGRAGRRRDRRRTVLDRRRRRRVGTTVLGRASRRPWPSAAAPSPRRPSAVAPGAARATTGRRGAFDPTRRSTSRTVDEDWRRGPRRDGVDWIEEDLDASEEPEPEGSGYERPPALRRWGTLLAAALLLGLGRGAVPGHHARRVRARRRRRADDRLHGRGHVRAARAGRRPALGPARSPSRPRPWHLLRSLVGLVPSLVVAGSVVVILLGVSWWLIGNDHWAIGGLAVRPGAAGPDRDDPGRGARPARRGRRLVGAAVADDPHRRPARAGRRRARGRSVRSSRPSSCWPSSAVFVAQILTGAPITWAPLPTPVLP